MALTSTQWILYTTFKINAEVQMERIRQLRKERGLSQAKLAVMADMDPATLNRLERGTGNPNLKTLERVADALGVEVADFFPKAQRRSSLEPSLLNGLEEERRPTTAQLDAIEGLKRYSDLLERSVRRQASDDITAMVHQVGMHGYLKVLALLAEDEAVLPALRPVALRFTDLARKYIELVDDAGEDLERRVVDFEEYFRSRRAS